MPTLCKQGPNRYLLPKEGAMKVDALVFLNESLFAMLQNNGGQELQQLCDAATLPGVFGPVLGMPDIHAGFGLPIGGVLATRVEDGVVSAGAVGMDINCGVRLLSTNLSFTALDKPTIRALMEAVEVRVPTGIGRKSRHITLSREALPDVLVDGALALVERGYGRIDDVESIEEGGRMAGADPAAVSPRALQRAVQLSTLGGGNHFLEFGTVDEVADGYTAAAFGLQKGMVTVMIHTGSRGLGHQICTDYTEIMAKAARRYRINLPSKELACCPINSKEGRDYLAAMACAVNFAFANRQLITHDVREAFADIFGSSVVLNVVYDVAHNIAKFEEHFAQNLLVHRKGATRALPPLHPQNPDRYKKTGHPAIIPGSMNSPSYILTGTDAVRETFCSVNHGAGRVMSRSHARKNITTEAFLSSVGEVMLNTRNVRQLLDEAPLAYKNISEVVSTLNEIGLTNIVARLRPLAVIKGEGDE